MIPKPLWLAIAACVALLPAAPVMAHSVCGPGSHWIDSCDADVDILDTEWTFGLDLNLDGNLDCQSDLTIVVSGPMRIKRTAALDDSAKFPGTRAVDGHLDVIDTEIVSLALSDGALTTVTAGAGYGSGADLDPTDGAIAEDAGNDALGQSYFEVFLEATYSGATYYNHAAIPIEAVEDGVPSDAPHADTGSICIGGYANPKGGMRIANIVSVSYDISPPPGPITALSDVPCVGNLAGPFACRRVDLEALIPLSEFDAGTANDLWGWTDPNDGSEYAILGLSGGAAFVDLGDPKNPVYLGLLPAHTNPAPWRDIKVDGSYAFIVSDDPGHGMQIFDLTQLSGIASPPVTLTETAYYAGFGSAHNIAIDEATHVAYATASDTCGSGLHMVDISNPLAPSSLGCHSNGYVHDTQCVVYSGPDVAHQGDEICFDSNPASGSSLEIVDVTNKNATTVLSDTSYPGAEYAHQGWLTEDQRYFLMGDELDEISSFGNTRTLVWDVSDLDAPSFVGSYLGATTAIDHNLYVRGNRVFEANYTSGLRILEFGNLGALDLSEVAYFDTYPSTDDSNLLGAWSVYPFFDSGIVVVSDMINGLFVLRPHPPQVPAIGAGSVAMVGALLGAAGLAGLRRRRRARR